MFSIKTADPARNYEPTGHIVAKALYSTLVTYAEDDVNTPIGLLADSWEVSEDGLTYTFKLNPDAVFSDGTKVTSADVVFSMKRIANILGNASFLVDGMTFTAPDPETVVLTTAEFDPAVLAKLTNPSLGIVNSAAAKKIGATDASDAADKDTAEKELNKASLGSGPYTLEKFDPTAEVIFVKNDKYWGKAPKFDRVVLRNVDASQQKANVTSGQSDIALDLSPDKVKDLDGSSDVSVDAGPNSYTFYLLTKNNAELSKWTANSDVQDAIRFGMDYDGLLKIAGEGAVRSPGMISQQLSAALPQSDAVPFDLEKAKASLKASGYDGTPIELSYPNDLSLGGVTFTDLATRIQSNLKDVGLNIELKSMPIATLLDPAIGPKQQIALWYWGADFPDPSNFLVFGPGGPSKRIDWAAGSDPTIEAIMAKAKAERDPKTRISLYQDFQRELNKGPVMSILQPAQVILTSKKVTNITYNMVWTINIAEIS